MARKLISTHYFPAQGADRFVVFLAHAGGSGAHAELATPTDLNELMTFFSALSNAACQFKLTAGAVAKVEVYYERTAEGEHLRFHDVQILNSSKIVGAPDAEDVKARFTSLFEGQEVSMNTGIQGICSNICDGNFVEIFDCEDILTMTLQCDSGECGSGGGGRPASGDDVE